MTKKAVFWKKDFKDKIRIMGHRLKDMRVVIC